jgi:hypothetical protein
VDSVDWGTVSAIGALTAASLGYLARQIHRVEDKLSARMDRMEGRMDRMESTLRSDIGQLTERYIAHLERHPH